MNYNFTDRVRQSLASARDEAFALGHDYVGTEHILLGLLRDDGGVASRVLDLYAISATNLRDTTVAMLREGKGSISKQGELPYTSRAKKVLEFAMAEAREMNHSYVGTEHLLLALIREEKGIASEVLRQFGLPLERARNATRWLLGGKRGDPPAGIGDEAATPEPTSSFRVTIDDASNRSIYEQIVEQIREAVATGTLKPGHRLPSVRRMADDLDIAPGTVARAYSELEGLGVVVTEGARGTRVAENTGNGIAADERPETLSGLLRPVAVAAFHLGADAQELRDALEVAMSDIFPASHADAA